MKTAFIILALLPLFLIGQNSDQRIISVRGESEITLIPDKIELTITFSETENVKKENELLQKENQLKKLVKRLSIELKNLSIDNFAANRYGYYNSSSNKVRMSKTFKLQLENIDLADTLIIQLFEIGANYVAVTNLFSNKLEQIKLKSTKMAIDNAKMKAEIMALHSGNQLGRILEISEYNHKTHPYLKPNSYLLNSKLETTYNANQNYSNNNGNVEIRKIRIRFIVDITFELI